MSAPPAGNADLPHLVHRSQDGDRAALEQLLVRYLPGVRAFVRLRMGAELRARESGSDIVQSVCADLLASPGFVFQDEERFRSWLFVAALNKIRNHGRWHGAQKRDAAREEALGSDDVRSCYATVLSPSRELMGRERVAKLERAFDRLPEHYREVVTLARIAGLSYAEIATTTGRTVDSVRNVLARALNQLGTLLESESEP